MPCPTADQVEVLARQAFLVVGPLFSKPLVHLVLVANCPCPYLVQQGCGWLLVGCQAHAGAESDWVGNAWAG